MGGSMLRFSLLISGIALCSIALWRAPNEQRYAEAHAYEPIFAYPGVDTALLREANLAFIKSADAALPHFPENDLREAIYPLAFLQKIPETEDARRTLLAQPTRENAAVYHEKVIELIDAHKEALIKAHALLEGTKDMAVYSFFNGKTTARYVQFVLEHALEANTEAKNKEKRRYSCLNGNLFSCENTTLLRLGFGDTAQDKELVAKSPATHVDLLETLYPGISVAPRVIISRSTCLLENAASFAITQRPSRLSKVSGIHLVYLDDLYFENTASSTHPFYRALYKEGATLTYQPFNAYLCPDMGEDMGRALSMHHLQRELRSKSFSIEEHGEAHLQALIVAQEKYRDATIPTEAEYTRFIAAASTAVREETSLSLAKKLGGDEERLRLLSLTTQAKTHSALLEGVIGYFDDLQVGSYIPYKLNPTPPSLFLIARGGLSQLYGLSNMTVFPEHVLLTESFSENNLAHAPGDVPFTSLEKLGTDVTSEEIQKALLKDQIAQNRAFKKYIEEIQAQRQ